MYFDQVHGQHYTMKCSKNVQRQGYLAERNKQSGGMGWQELCEFNNGGCKALLWA